MSESKNSNGIGFFTLLGLVFVVLKLTKYIVVDYASILGWICDNWILSDYCLIDKLLYEIINSLF